MLYCYDLDTYDTVMDVFDLLPIAAVINGEYLTLHGGVSDRF